MGVSLNLALKKSVKPYRTLSDVYPTLGNALERLE
jgi:hypothetical protein